MIILLHHITKMQHLVDLVGNYVLIVVLVLVLVLIYDVVCVYF